MFAGVSANWASSRPGNGTVAGRKEREMLDLLMAIFTTVIVIVLTILLLGYLVVTLLYPERF
jgi:K+-transporting ATPase KdpF subunit